jgi:hypothetical protein
MKEQLEQELKELQAAYAQKLLTTNEYSSAYYNISQKLKKICLN